MDVWDELHPTSDQQRQLYDWLVVNGEQVLTGDSFFHLAAYGDSLPGLNLCGAGRVVCLIDPVGDVYACPFAIHENFLAGNVLDEGGFARVWRNSDLFTELRGLYEPFLDALALHFVLAIPPVMAKDQAADNWQRSAWMSRTPGIGDLPSGTSGGDHFD